MNPISKVTGAITHPLRTATSVAGGAMGVAAAGVRTATRIVGRGGEEVDAPAPSAPSPKPSSGPAAAASPTLAVKAVPPDASDTTDAQGEAPAATAAKKAPAKKAPAKKSSAKKSPAKKSTAKKAPSAQAATAGPAMAPEALAAIDQALDGDTSHVETETETVYTSETASGSGPDEGLTEPLIDPEVAAALRSEIGDPHGADADADKS